MNKPILVARADFIKALADLINNSGLPSYMLEPVVKDALSDIRRVMNQQFEDELKAYQEASEKK